MTACTVAENDCSLRGAISNATAGDTVDFHTSLLNTTITLGSVINLTRNITISGLGANKSTISGNNLTKLFSVQANVIATISGLKITDGNSGGQSGNAGGLDNFGNLTIDKCLVTGNTADSYAGGIGNFNGGSLTVLNSTVSNNIANFSSNSNGGGISSDGSLILVNSTISGNSATASSISGGGILIFGGSATIINSTITNNSTATTSEKAGGIYILNFYTNGQVVLRNSIVAANVNNSVIPDVAKWSGSVLLSSAGSNLIGNIGIETTFTALGDQTGTAASPLNPRLSPLCSNGGAFPTHALLQNSMAINAGNNCVVNLSCASNNPPMALVNDQRGVGFSRNVGGTVDIGAFELLAPTAANVVISGKLSTPEGRGLRNTQVVLTDSHGNLRTVMSNSFGYFRFAEVEAGQTYIIGVRSKRYQFTPQILIINEDVTKLILTANE